jgi:hypothetical protein
MKPIIKFLLATTVLFLLLICCKREELDIDKLSKNVEVQRVIVAPLVYGELSLGKLMGESTDTIITIKGDTLFQDTISLNLPDQTQDFTVEYLSLPYHARNYLPVGANLMLITYDSVSNSVLDTIKFAQSGLFLTPAPLDADGYVIENEVIEKNDSILITKTTAENLLRLATHIIVDARLLCDTTRILPVNESQRIWLKIGINGKLTYHTKL